MGRPKSTNANLPPRMAAVRKKAKTYYFYDGGVETPNGVRYLALGADKDSAIQEWVRIESARANGERWHPEQLPDGSSPVPAPPPGIGHLQPFRLPRAGVYLLLKGDQVVYVGSSTNVVQRLAQHDDKEFDSVALVECSEGDRLAVERAYIRANKPPLNTAHILPWTEKS